MSSTSYFYDDENALSVYLKEINKIPLLNREEELELATLARQGNIEARDKLAKSHLRFVVNVAKKFQNQGMSLADLISEGNLGLLHAIERFDPDQGFHFISYAVWWIRQAIMKALGEKARAIRLPQNRANDLIQIEKTRKMLENEGLKATAFQISKLVDIKEDIVQDLMNVAQGMVSLDITTRSDGDNTSTIGEFIADDRYKTSQEVVEEKDLKTEINHLLSELNEKEAKVIELRFGLNGKQSLSLKDIGKQLNLTKERIRQIEKKALFRLQQPSRKERLLAYAA